MATGLYGQTIAANVNADDIEIWYSYSETRNSDSVQNSNFKQLDSNILQQQIGNGNTLDGLYKLNLPYNEFSQKGFYTVYIKPREIKVTLNDMSSLSDYPDVNGIVVNYSNISDSYAQTLFSTNNGLVGYRVAYPNGGSKTDICRIVTSNNRCEPVIKQLTNSDKGTTLYRYNNSSNLTFITVTPSLATSFAPNMVPFIGEAGQEVVFINTKFSPIMLDIEMTEHDSDTISIMLENTQVYNAENGLVTTFDDNGNIYHQAQTYTIKDEYTGDVVKKVREKQENFTEETLE